MSPLRSRSLRTRLLATVLLLLAVAAAVITVVTALMLRGFLYGKLDDDLRTESRIQLLALPGMPAPSISAKDKPPGTLVALVHNGQVVAAGVNSRDGDVIVPPEEFADIVAVRVGAPPVTVDLGPLGVYRMNGAPGRFAGDVVVTGLPERRLQETVTRLVTTELAVSALVLVGAGVAGTIVVRRELRPLERVAATAAGVTDLPLDRGEVSLVERVPDADPHTEVGQVGAALNRMLDHVEGALSARHDSETQLRQFIADASHELRTPLAAIRGYTELTLRGPLPPDAEYALARIASQGERMTTLVEDLLLLARLDAGRPLERKPVDLTRLVLDAVNDARVAGPEHRWSLDLPEVPVAVTGDPSRLAQVLANLLANARTHTPAGIPVTVTLSETASGGARLTVVDEGPGIAADLLPHVFERFARGSTSRSRDNGSTGLGLAIVDAVVTAHDGTVRVASGPGRTTFTVDLPA
ncbi:sensor histidine kinase [Pseudonocardia sp. TRM90224]|uniref:sensor histidine kinase n=1 Tax=Pseudonocardia sp. TRM90224 TaxID=2812678 RepID=UPI001E560012|nr:HAMP domain-containing sensor histidine kinase [Pseudonocardia sp. TRM90224]